MESLTGTAGQETKIELFIWNAPDTEPATATRTLTKPIPSSEVLTVDYDISPYLREYIDHSEFTQVTTGVADAPDGEYCYCRAKKWVNGLVVDNDYYVATVGYGYFEDLYNPTNGGCLRSDINNQVHTGTNGGNLYLYNDLSVTWQVRYTSFAGTVVTNTFASFTSEMVAVPCIPDALLGEGGVTVEILKNAILRHTYVFTEVCEAKYDVMTCDFVNRYGMWQQLPLFKASRTSLSMENKAYKLMPESVNYDINKNIKQTFNTNMTEMVKVNTGWLDESNNEILRQLMLSNIIRLDGKPVVLSSKTLDEKKGVNDNLINYELSFEYANNMLNYIQ
jgi:hypothetical protein